MLMLVAERHQKIIEQIVDKRIVKVAELSQLFSVTEETIRRDLEKLEKQGYLTRSHGGAVLNEKKEQDDIPFEQREITNIDAKKRLARIALRYVKPADTIILDASSTAWYMAQIIPDVPLTVITNSLKVVAELSKKKNIDVICTGGTLLSRSASFVGPLAIKALEKYYVNKAFISCKGMHLERGFTESNEQQALVKQKMLETSEQTFMLLDDSKVGVQAFSVLSELNMADYLIVNAPLPNAIITELNEEHQDLDVIID